MIRVLKNEEIARQLIDDKQLQQYLFCMKYDKKAGRDRNQRVALDVCKKSDCKYLDETCKCHCPASMQYGEGMLEFLKALKKQ